MLLFRKEKKEGEFFFLPRWKASEPQCGWEQERPKSNSPVGAVELGTRGLGGGLLGRGLAALDGAAHGGGLLQGGWEVRRGGKRGEETRKKKQYLVEKNRVRFERETRGSGERQKKKQSRIRARKKAPFRPLPRSPSPSSAMPAARRRRKGPATRSWWAGEGEEKKEQRSSAFLRRGLRFLGPKKKEFQSDLTPARTPRAGLFFSATDADRYVRYKSSFRG